MKGKRFTPSTVSIHLSPNVTVGHLSIFSKARKCPSFHTVLGNLRIDPKKVINLLMPSFNDVLFTAYKSGNLNPRISQRKIPIFEEN